MATQSNILWGGSQTFNNTTFGLGGWDVVNRNGDSYIAYCFTSKPGFSKVDSYAGNGTTSHLIQTGFEPAFLLIKGYTHGGGWVMLDNKRNSSNPRNNVLYAESGGAEQVNDIYAKANFLSNGFELLTNDSGINMSGRSYIYLAIAADGSTTTPSLANSFNAQTYSGTGSARSITGLGFKPDLLWWKAINSGSYNWKAVDSINGPTKNLYQNLTNALASDVATTSFDSDGFTFGSGGNGNTGGINYVNYAWKAGVTPSINTDGSITSLVSANQAAGFSIVQYTGTGSNATIGHGLGATPQLIIDKVYSTSGYGWTIYSEPTGTGKALTLNSDGAVVNDANFCSAVGIDTITSYYTSSSQNHIAYFFRSIPNYSKIGSYTGSNGASTKTITTGFEPGFVMIKRTDAAGGWRIFDGARDPGSPPKEINSSILANSSAAGYTASGSGNGYLFFSSTGFYFPTGYANADINGSGTYIYLAIKEN